MGAALDSWEIKRQLAYLAAAAVWADSPGNVIFTGGAFVSEDLEGNFLPHSFRPDGPVTKAIPFCRVTCNGWDFDPENPYRISSARFSLWITAGSGGSAGGTVPTTAAGYDTHGINMETGALRHATSPQGKSDGRSVDELSARFVETYPVFTDAVHGIQGVVRLAGGMIPVSGVTMLTRWIDIEVFNATVSRTYHPPRQFQAVAAGGGVVSLAWVNPPTRYDSYRNILRRGTNPGDAAPTTVSGGTGITVTGGNLGVAASDPGHSAAQVFSYALFHQYSEVLTGDRDSGAVGASVTVT